MVTCFILQKRLNSCSYSHLLSQGDADAHAALCNNYWNDISLVQKLKSGGIEPKKNQTKKTFNNDKQCNLALRMRVWAAVDVDICVRCVWCVFVMTETGKNWGTGWAKTTMRKERVIGNRMQDTVCFQDINHILFLPPLALPLSPLKRKVWKKGIQHTGRSDV